MTDETPALRPPESCPFCGECDFDPMPDGMEFYATCLRCFSSGPGAPTKDAAIEAWNHRTSSDGADAARWRALGDEATKRVVANIIAPLADERLSEIRRQAAGLTYEPTRKAAFELLAEIDRLRAVIAAAPDLLAACRAARRIIVAAVTLSVDLPDFDPNSHSVVMEIDAALAKAEGDA